MSRIMGSYMAMQDSFPTSAAVDLLFLWDSPCGFAKFVLSKPSARAYLFISWMKYFMGWSDGMRRYSASMFV